MPRANHIQPLTNRHLEAAFGVTTMTLYLWRKGTPTKTALPVIDPTARLVTYDARKVEAWARRNGVPLLVRSLLDREWQDGLHAGKPGPKFVSEARKRPRERAAGRLAAAH